MEKHLTQDTLIDDEYEEEWQVVINNGGKYTLGKNQARILIQAMNLNQRQVIFQTFTIMIPYIAEFYRTKRFLKDTYKLSARATEPEYKPISKERFDELKKDVYSKIGKEP